MVGDNLKGMRRPRLGVWEDFWMWGSVADMTEVKLRAAERLNVLEAHNGNAPAGSTSEFCRLLS